MASKMQPGITVNGKIWEKFKKKYNKNASQKVEELMKASLESETLAALFSSNGVETISFQDPSKWNLSFSDSKIQLTNISYSCSDENSLTNTNGTTDNSILSCNSNIKDIEIE